VKRFENETSDTKLRKHSPPARKGLSATRRSAIDTRARLEALLGLLLRTYWISPREALCQRRSALILYVESLSAR
jgi:hypothetical protein